MPRVVSVRLRHPGQFYDFDAGDLQLAPGDWVIVETVRGQDAGQVVLPPAEVAAEDVQIELKPVARAATAADLRRMERFQQREAEVLARTRARVAEEELPMRLVAAEYTYNGRSLTIYFTAEKRVDFRELVKELAREFRTRIELRQIGARDEARLLGGIGSCGRLLCCSTFLRDFLRISVRMAKEQELPLSPMKISGVCGRLLCCLSYECDQYREIRAQLPTVGEEVVTPRGSGKVIAVSVPKEMVTVELRPGMTVETTMAELAQAARSEVAGRLAAGRPARRPELEEAGEEEREEQVAVAESAPSSAEELEKRRRRRRRRRKKTEGEAAAPPERAHPASPPSPQRRRSPRRPGPEKAAQEKPHPAPASQQAPSGEDRRRRRPRRRPPQGTPPKGDS